MRRVPALNAALHMICLSLLVLHGRAWGTDQPREFPPPVVLEATLPRSEGDSPQYREIIGELVRIELTEAGLEWVQAPSGRVLGPLGGQTGGGEAPAVCLEAARESAADYLLLSLYATRPDGIAVEFTLYKTSSGAPVARIRREQRIDLRLDRMITEAMRQLLQGAAAELAGFTASARQTREAPVGSEVREAPEAPQAPEPQAAFPPSAPAESATAPRSPPSRFRRLELAAGGAPFLPVGSASDYFKIGLFSTFGAAYRFGFGALVLGCGLEAGSSVFEASGASSSAQTILAPVGVLLSCAVSYGTPLEMAIRLSGGAALLSMAPSGLNGRLNKLLPYASGGIGLGFGIGPSFGVTVDTRLVVYFEQAYGKFSPLLGLTPAVCLYLRV